MCNSLKRFIYALFRVEKRGLTRKLEQSLAAACRKSGLKSVTRQRTIKANTLWRCSTAKRHTNGILTCRDKVGRDEKRQVDLKDLWLYGYLCRSRS